MEMTRLITAAILTVILSGFNTFPCSEAAKDKGHGLHVGFYNRKCPKVEQIVAEVVSKAAEADPKLPGALLRLFFHDCFVKGCDASIMLDATPSNEPVEMTSLANGGVRGFEVIDEIKDRLEEECPETVSCADILAIASREAVALSGLPRHKVPAGRRDSRTSRATDVDLPLPTTPMDEMIDYFTRRDLTADDMVALLGAHSIGTARCGVFDYRMYNFDENQGRDPSLNPFYAAELSKQCPAPNTLPPEEAENRVADFDPITPLVLDNKYYINLLQGKGLLQSDQALASDLRTSPLVFRMAASPESFSRRFARAIIKMGRINVLTGPQGEIRKTCRAFNN